MYTYFPTDFSFSRTVYIHCYSVLVFGVQRSGETSPPRGYSVTTVCTSQSPRLFHPAPHPLSHLVNLTLFSVAMHLFLLHLFISFAFNIPHLIFHCLPRRCTSLGTRGFYRYKCKDGSNSGCLLYTWEVYTILNHRIISYPRSFLFRGRIPNLPGLVMRRPQ